MNGDTGGWIDNRGNLLREISRTQKDWEQKVGEAITNVLIKKLGFEDVFTMKGTTDI